MNNTSKKLIQLSMKFFSEKGYYGTSLNDIANELGIKKASLYNYIKSKDELYKLCIEKCMVDIKYIIAEIDTQSENIYDELSSFVQTYITKSEYLVKFYIQLSFAPSNFVPYIEKQNHILSDCLCSKLEQIYENSNIKINQLDFILLIRMTIYGWLYRKTFTQSINSIEQPYKEFEIHLKLLFKHIY